MSRPLSHIRVLDFGQYLAGPLVGMMLADLGAEVIRVDPPDGPAFDDPAFAMLSRGKKTITLDLKTDEGVKTALELVKRADVVIENFRPGSMRRLGVGPEDLHAINDQLIYLSMPGFASTDLELADIPAWEAVIAAYTGQFTDMGLNRILMGINPSFSPLSLASAYGASFGALAVQFALFARDRNGGDHIEVPLASALLEGLVYNCLKMEGLPERYKSPREIELDRRRREELPLDLSFAELSEFFDPFYRTYTCSDGRGFYVVSNSIAAHPRRTLEVLGLKDLADELPNFSAYLDTSDWPAEWTQRNYPVGALDRSRIAAAMKQAFLTKSSYEWEELFGAAKAPGTAQRSTEEWLNDPHALASGLILNVSDTTHGEMRQMGNVAWLQGDLQATTKSGPVPATLESLLQEPLRNRGQTGQGSWLEGLKVLDLTNVIAGPTVGSTLARFGAKVTAVQPVVPSVDPWNAVIFGLQAQRGKESILLDLGTARGREILDELLAGVDVVTVNATDAQRDGLGLSPHRLRAINPKLILVQLDAYGGPERGSKSDHLGYDDLAQAATGVMLRFGGGMSTPEEHAHFGTIDVLGGFFGCVALGAALIRLKETGEGSVARSSLAAAGNTIQSQFMYDFADRAPFNEPAGRNVLGWGPFYHCYEAADGWMFFAAPTDRAASFSCVPELADLVDASTDVVGVELPKRFKTRPAAYWRNAFRGSNVAVPLRSLDASRKEGLQVYEIEEIDLSEKTYRAIRFLRHPMGRWIDLVAPNAVRPSSGRVTIPGHMPKYGQHTREVLLRIGYDEESIADLVASRVVGESWSEKYLPE